MPERVVPDRGELLLALDLGTTRICALVVTPQGRVLGRAERPVQSRFPEPGRVEQDPQAWWHDGVDVMRAALASAAARATDLAALGVVTQRATVVAWERDGAVLAPAIGWQDQRTAERVAQLRARGIPINTQASATKIEWWMQRDPRVARAHASGRLRLGNPDAWLTDRLTRGAAFVTDPGCAAATGVYGLADATWSDGACGLFGVPRESLPDLVPTACVVGETPADLLGAPVPVAARAGDQQAAVFAQGAHAPGRAKLTLGTSAMLDVHVSGVPERVPPGCYPLVLWRLSDDSARDAICVEGSVHTAGAILEWLVELGVIASASEVDALASSVPDAAGVAFVPALQGLGSPWLDDGARGLVIGLTRGTTRAHLVRAALEGIAARCADLCEALAVEGPTLPVDGGLANSNVLLQCIADRTGLVVERAAELETTALGAALLAGLAVGVLPDLRACAATRRVGTRFTPRTTHAERTALRHHWRRTVARARTP